MPNLPVDVNSWGRSACYPQGSFYPLSDGPSMRCRRITKPDFRPCSTRLSRSQTPFCLCTLRMVSIHAEGIFGRLRYSLGGDRPSQTAHLTLSRPQFHEARLELTLSRPQFHEARLELQCIKGSIPTSAPRILAYPYLSLLPILYIMHQSPISGYSKAPWGLSV